MKPIIILRRVGGLAILGSIVCAVMLSGCGSGAGDKSAPANAAAGKEGSAIPVNSASPASGATTTGNVLAPGETQKPDTRNNENPRAATVTKAQIGTGGSDFFIFTQARAALGADAELKAANITIDVKAGVLTLSGTVANAAQKSKAEQTLRALSGVKAVKNQLRTST
ncbi:MAG: BON domain-containing protein [Pyrinomonadaceae bacterium]